MRALLFKKKKERGFYRVNSGFFLTIWWKAPFWLVENQKKKRDRYLGDPARGQAYP
jgi:hypothetical protein